MRIYLGLIGLGAWMFQAAQAPAPAVVQDLTHFSQVMGGNRTYQVLLPPSYAASKKRYPVIYWFHGYEQSNPERDAELASYVATHDVILVNTGPVETQGSYPLYFPELVDQIDKTLRTIPDRDHRAVTGFTIGGFVALWMAGKYPELVSSASSFNATPEASVGPRDLDVECNLEDQYNNYDGVQTRLVTGMPDSAYFYHRRMNAIWMYTRIGHETESFDSEHGFQAIPKTLDFHLHAFANPLPKRSTFSHTDVYPNFGVWGWEVVSDRKQPGFTVLENVSNKGFRLSVREWIPSGAVFPKVKLSISTARLYPPGSSHSVTYIRLRDGNVSRAAQKADAQGRLSFDLDGDAHEVGISDAPLLAVGGYEIADAAWATAGKPVKLRVKFWNKGAAPSATSTIQWESTNPLVKFEFPSSRLFGLKPGESAVLPVTFTVADNSRAMVKIYAVESPEPTPPGARTGRPAARGGPATEPPNRMPIDVPLFPPAESTLDFQIADGRAFKVYQHGVEISQVTYGEGNRDGHAAPGESFAVLLPEGEAMRAAELFTNDSCVGDSPRGDDSWNDYDHAGASVRYSLPTIRADCPPGHVIHVLARVWIPNAPNHGVRYAALEIPVWWRPGEEPKR
ncbi:MAG TPA: alpha/beta hydrolase-fold protein [Bryobacteraceae bacterium]|nr:alpha/beta hydrolase-fold protein [Bryobacteraceae bacterium]